MKPENWIMEHNDDVRIHGQILAVQIGKLWICYEKSGIIYSGLLNNSYKIKKISSEFAQKLVHIHIYSCKARITSVMEFTSKVQRRVMYVPMWVCKQNGYNSLENAPKRNIKIALKNDIKMMNESMRFFYDKFIIYITTT